jgi:hypothetical protein
LNEIVYILDRVSTFRTRTRPDANTFAYRKHFTAICPAAQDATRNSGKRIQRDTTQKPRQ